MDMNEDIFIKYFEGNCTPQEEQQLIDWASESNENMQELQRFKNIYVRSTMPSTEATDAQYGKFKQALKDKEQASIRKHNRIAHIFGYGIASMVAILLGLNLIFNWWYVEPQEPTVRLYQLADSQINTLYTEKAVKAQVTLPDGSKVWLNSDSRISYPTTFTGASREVEFSGEGYFEVTKDSLCPMIIRCNKDFRVEVYGTTFNIKSYDNDKYAQTTLYSGSITLVNESTGIEQSIVVEPNKSYTIEPHKNINEATISNTNNIKDISAWKEGKIIFKSTPMPEVIKILERWHGTKFHLESEYARNLTITAVLEQESVVQIMELISFSTDLSYTINKDKSITLK